ncbi:MAG TPA: OB-fold domain-containing protein [Methanoregulaceae archaeon]|nr:OB-fold domain-containing protein [Methanoregulaceae archaeon]HQJ87822.1 OB-fold domain-containing protein [Methanoregulaceae archaeon]
MFAYLEGTVDPVDERSAVIDVGLIGFRVQAPAPVLAALRPKRAFRGISLRLSSRDLFHNH